MLLAGLVCGHAASAQQPGAVARIFSRNISSQDLDPTPSEKREITKEGGAKAEKALAEYRQEKLSGLIWGALLEDYYDKNKITATPAEINAFARAVLKQRTARGPVRQLAEEEIKHWKFNRAVYKQYGGTVIFQQSDPFEPVGAYRRFLEEQQQKGAFEIFDPQLKRDFWEYYTSEQPMVVPPSEVNYDKPWWLQKPK
jgi:hypothetical protein